MAENVEQMFRIVPSGIEFGATKSEIRSEIE